MARKQVIFWAVLGTILVVLAVGLASVGAQFDQERLTRQDLEMEVEDLHDELGILAEEHDALQQKAQEQLKTIEQLHAQLEQARHAYTASQTANHTANTTDARTP